MGNTMALHSEDACFRISSGLTDYELRVSWLPSLYPNECCVSTLKRGQDTILQKYIYPQFMIIFSAYSIIYNLCSWNGAII